MPERFQRFLDAVPAAVAMLEGPEHRFSSYNDSYHAMIGRREAHDLPVAEALPEMVEQGIIDLLDRVYRTGESFSAKAKLVQIESEAGELEDHWLDFAYVPMHDDEGFISGIIVHAIDVSASVVSEQRALELAGALDVERRTLATLIEEMPAGVVLADQNGSLVLGNRVWREIFGVPIDVVDGIEDYVHFVGFHDDGRRYEPNEYPTARALQLRETVRAERIRFERPDTPDVWLDIWAAPLLAEDGSLTGAIATCVDVTEQLSLEQQIIEERADGMRQAAQAAEHRAYEIHDTVLQRLAVADLAFELGQEPQGRQAVRDAMSITKELVNQWGASSQELRRQAPALALDTEHA